MLVIYKTKAEKVLQYIQMYMYMHVPHQKVSEYDQEIPQSQTADQPKSYRAFAVTRDLKDNNS